MNTDNQNRGWERELRTILLKNSRNVTSDGVIELEMVQDIDSVIESIQNLREKDKQRVEEVMGGLKKESVDWSKDEHGKKCADGCTYCSHAEGMTVGYNQALSDLKQKVSEIYN